MSTSNFSFLSAHSPLLAELGATAERLYPYDPASCVLKLRLLAESLTQEVAERVGLTVGQSTQAELLRAVDQRLGLDPQVRQILHALRQRGNEAAHQVNHRIGYREGLESIKLARELALWFHRTFGNAPQFKPGPFVLPDDPSQKLVTLQQQIAALQGQLQQTQTAQAAQAEIAQLLEAQAAQERDMARRAHEERAIYEQLAEEASQRLAELQKALDERPRTPPDADPAKGDAAALRLWAERSAQAAQQVAMDEASTRLLIDQMLRDAGWEADSTLLRHKAGARPTKGRNLAIAEADRPEIRVLGMELVGAVD